MLTWYFTLPIYDKTPFP